MEALPTSRQELRETARAWRLYLFAALLTLGMTAILSFNVVWTSQVTAEEGAPAPNDVLAPRAITYTSEVLTERAREQARNGIPDAYSPLNLSIGREELAAANAVFDFMETVRADTLATPEERVAHLQAIVAPPAVSESTAVDVLSLSPADFASVRTEILGIIDDLMRQEIRAETLAAFQDTARRQASLGLSPAQSNIVTSLAPEFIMPTVFPDVEATAAAREAAAAEVQPVIRNVAQNQRILRAGDLVTPEDMEMLEQLGLLRRDINWRNVLSGFLVSLLAVTLITLYWQKYSPGFDNSNRYLAVLGGIVLLFTLGARLMAPASANWALLFPLAALSMIVAVVFEPRYALLITVVIGAIFGLYAPDSLRLAVFAVAGGMISVLTLRDSQRIVAYFRSGLLAALAQMLVILVFALPAEAEPLSILTQGVYSLGNGLLAAGITLVGFFILGGAFGIITTVQLQDLSRLDHPLLQELLRRAPGTYHHSIMVANLAEQAAERVQANSTLVRVGAFYHDIGKMNRPPFFTENQEGINPHDSLDPYTSARIILSHVPDGLELARRYRLPDKIRAFIAEHHGRRLVKGFYFKAQAQAGDEADEVDPEKFRYAGPRPRSRESGIVMLADSIEATSSALRPDSMAAIEKLVNSIVDEDVMEGQLNNSGLSLGDIEAIRASFIETLKGRFHVRVKYPGNEQLTAPAPAPALPAGSVEMAEIAAAAAATAEETIAETPETTASALARDATTD